MSLTTLYYSIAVCQNFIWQSITNEAYSANQHVPIFSRGCWIRKTLSKWLQYICDPQMTNAWNIFWQTCPTETCYGQQNISGLNMLCWSAPSYNIYTFPFLAGTPIKSIAFPWTSAGLDVSSHIKSSAFYAKLKYCSQNYSI
jgi:hypothetical protein